MKLFISGSPRTKTCYKIIKDVMTVNDAIFPLNELNIHYCKGCGSCQENLDSRCVMQDEMDNIYNNIDDFETLIIVTPIYYNHITALMKTFLERLNPYLKTGKLHNKKVYLILTGEASKIDNEEVISDIEMYFENLSISFGMEFKTSYYFNPDETLKPFYIDKIMEIKNEIYKL